MFEAWGRVLSRRRRLTLALTLLFVAFAGIWSTGWGVERFLAGCGL
jgi:hypothetical protein